jgi:hypothetical protein
MTGKIDLEQIKLANTLKSRFDMFVSWRSDFVITSPGRMPEFRGSGIPHCPIRWAAEFHKQVPTPDERNFMLDFVSERGRLTHEMTQKWLGIIGIMFGKWKCRKCNKVYPEDTKQTGVMGPVYCCNDPTEYVEYDMKNKDFDFGGHCDGVVQICGKFTTAEFKERNQDEIDTYATHGVPKFANLLQVTAYRHELPQLLAPTVPLDMWHDYVFVIYISRQDVRKRVIFAVPYDPSIFHDEIKNVRRTRRIIEIGCYNRLVGICKNASDDRFCEYNSACFAPNPMKALEKVLPGISKPRKAEDIPERYRRASSK